MSASVGFPTHFEKDFHKDMLFAHLRSRIEKAELHRRWRESLDGARDEKSMQYFLEQFPELLPGLRDKHNGPRAGIIVSQFPFGSDYKADFAFVTTNSMELQFTFVEIENPSVSMFNKDDSFCQHFNHAVQQLRDWLLWSKGNMEHLLHMYADLFANYNVSADRKSAKAILIYGRRSETLVSQRRKERWSSLVDTVGNDIEIMTYDRLESFVVTHPSDEVMRDLAVCSYKDRRFVLKPSSILQSTNIECSQEGLT